MPSTAVTSYANYRSELGYSRVDGTYASSVGDIKMVMGSATYGHCSGVFRSTNAGDRAALEDLMSVDRLESKSVLTSRQSRAISKT